MTRLSTYPRNHGSRGLATVTRGAREAIAAVFRAIFAQPDHATAMTQQRKVADGLRGRFVQAAALLQDAAEDILAYRHLPIEHQRQLHSTNPLERLNKEIRRRSNVVGILPTPQSGWSARFCSSKTMNGLSLNVGTSARSR
jgi:putative transposase